MLLLQSVSAVYYNNPYKRLEFELQKCANPDGFFIQSAPADNGGGDDSPTLTAEQSAQGKSRCSGINAEFSGTQLQCAQRACADFAQYAQ